MNERGLISQNRGGCESSPKFSVLWARGMQKGKSGFLSDRYVKPVHQKRQRCHYGSSVSVIGNSCLKSMEKFDEKMEVFMMNHHIESHTLNIC